MTGKLNQVSVWAGLACLTLAGSVSAAGLNVVPGLAVYDADGFIKISGEIQNNTGQTVCGAGVDIFFKDAAGKPITVTSIVTETKAGLGQEPSDGVVATRDWVPNGEVAVFTYLRDIKKLGGVKAAKHEIKASARSCDGALPKITVEGFSDKVDSMGYHDVSGTLRNTGNVACRSPKIVLGMYDASNKLIESRYIEPDEYFQKKLAPGKTVKFQQGSISAPDFGKFASFKYWGDCATHEP